MCIPAYTVPPVYVISSKVIGKQARFCVYVCVCVCVCIAYTCASVFYSSIATSNDSNSSMNFV